MMVNKCFNTVTEQVAQALRDGIREGRWQGTMPGRNRLAAELGVKHKTVKAALETLGREGLLEAPGRDANARSGKTRPPSRSHDASWFWLTKKATCTAIIWWKSSTVCKLRDIGRGSRTKP